LIGVCFKNADLESVVFEKCNLQKADLSGANITATGFDGCHIKETILDIEGFIKYGNAKGFILDSNVAQ
jgi:uncharacterized protein YjbI with pentapeptide repeats